MPIAARMVIVSIQPELCTIVKSGLLPKPDIEMIITVGTLAEAENKLSRTAPNMLLVDLDSMRGDTMFLHTLINRYKVLVVLTALSNMRAVPLMKGEIRDFIPKPLVFNNFTASNYLSAIYKRIGGLYKIQIPVNVRDIARMADSTHKVIAIASSTGGTEALECIIRALPVNVPPIVAVQHMPSGFTKLFANRLNILYPLEIKEAQSGDYLKQGQLLLAPADFHMRLVWQQGKLAVDCYAGTKIHGVMPAADVLFESVSELVKANAIGVILTGMGADGARGLMLMHNNGAKTIGQDKESCIVYGMPKVAKDLGAVDFELPIDQIAQKILSLI